MSNPDLSAVLQTLSTFSQSQTHQRPRPPSTSTSTSTRTTSSTTAISKTPSSSQTQSQSQSQSSSSSSSQTKSTADPSSITTWPSALRFVMHHQTAHNNHSSFLTHIRRLIATQNALERKWWEERESLVRKQAARGERKRELERVLQSVGAATTTASSTVDGSSVGDQQTKENAVELAYHDAKIHKAATELSRTTSAELRRLGVPFFAIDENLVVATASTDPKEKAEGKMSKQELAVLQRRMLELLQDLCRD